MMYQKNLKYIVPISSFFTIIIITIIIIICTIAPPISEAQTIEAETVLTMPAESLVNSFGNYGFTYHSEENAIYYNGERVQQFVDDGAYYRGGRF